MIIVSQNDGERLDIKTIELHKLVKNRNIDKTIIFNNTNKNGTEKEIYKISSGLLMMKGMMVIGKNIKTIELHKLVKNRHINKKITYKTTNKNTTINLSTKQWAHKDWQS